MDDLNDIYFFASVVQHGGFSAAARRIGVEKSRLSRRIAALEKRLGVRLLQRTTRALAKTLGHSQRVLVVSPAFLDHYGRPEHPADLPKFNTVASIDDIFDNGARWTLTNRGTQTQQVELKPRLVTSDLRTRLQAAIHGV